MKVNYLLGIVLLCQTYDAARILGIVPMPMYSHQAAFRLLWRELAARGHDVIVITTDPENDPDSKVKEINIHSAYKHKEYIVDCLTRPNHISSDFSKMMRKLDVSLTEYIFDLPQVDAILSNDTEHFDLVMTEVWFFTTFGLAEKYNCSLIGLSSLDLNEFLHELYGNPLHPVAYPDVFLNKQNDDMTFWERIQSALHLPLYKLSYISDRELTARENEIWRRYIKSDRRPGLQELMSRMSMIFVDVVPTLSRRPVGPALVNVGGNFHIHKSRPLPNDLQEFLDSAKNGAIYVSLGTNVKGDFITSKVRQAFLGAFRELPFKVLWKLDVKLEDVPENVKIVEWSPQQDVLRHANIKVFVFQGGLQSFEEAIANKIPMVGIPFISDQDTNVRKLTRNGFGVGLNKDTITKESLKEAILEVASNPKYKLAVAKMAEIIVDQPMTGLEKAVWWTEYVLRHKGAPHLRNPMMDLSIIDYYMLDMYLILIFVILTILTVVYLIFRSIFRCIRRLINPKPKSKPKSKRN